MKDRSSHRTPAYRAAQSARMKEYWRKKNVLHRRWERKISRRLRRNFVTNVQDDEVTAKVEILRKLMDKGELASFLSTKAHEIINEANGEAS